MQHLKIIDGDYWPASDTECHPAVMKQFHDVDVCLPLCKEKKVVIQAGGNCGIWARHLAKHFGTVYTFEPDADNFQCLTLNATAKNIIKMQAALGTRGHTPISLKTAASNVGAHRVGDLGNVPVIAIDELSLNHCDLMILDLEGYEYFALQGAINTIKDCQPVLMIEDKGHHRKYGIEENAMNVLLANYGYTLYEKIHRDIIMVPSARKR